MKVKVESEKVGLKLNIQKTKIMASGPFTSWQIDGETVETVSDFILGGKGAPEGRGIRDEAHISRRCTSAALQGVSRSESSEGQQGFGVFIATVFILSVANRCLAVSLGMQIGQTDSKWLKIYLFRYV